MGGAQMMTKDKSTGSRIHSKGRGHRLLGFALAAIGMIWLARQIGWLPAPEIELTIVWPIIVIAGGLFMALHTHDHCKKKITRSNADTNFH